MDTTTVSGTVKTLDTTAASDAATESVISVDKEYVSGHARFRGTRVPVEILFDYLAHGYNLDYFLYQYPSVSKEQAVALLKEARQWSERDSMAGPW